ncbi:MAG: hypothetical protein ACTSVI_16215 [Promethearchaeota archaeon]
MPVVKKIQDKFQELIELLKLSIPDNEILIIKYNFNEYIALNLEREEFINQIEKYLEKNDIQYGEEEIGHIYQDFMDELEKYPPSFQILLHELEYSHDKIKLIGISKKK